MKPPCTVQGKRMRVGAVWWTVWTPPEVSRVVDSGVVTGGRRGAAGGTNDY